MTDTALPGDQGARRRIFFSAAKEAAGMPALVLGASYLGFGSLARESGIAAKPTETRPIKFRLRVDLGSSGVVAAQAVIGRRPPIPVW